MEQLLKCTPRGLAIVGTDSAKAQHEPAADKLENLGTQRQIQNAMRNDVDVWRQLESTTPSPSTAVLCHQGTFALCATRLGHLTGNETPVVTTIQRVRLPRVLWFRLDTGNMAISVGMREMNGWPT